MSIHKNPTLSQGITLIEMMIGLSLSLIILSIVITIFLTAEKNFQLQTTLSTLQENSRFAKYFLRSAIKNAGYFGCPRLTYDFPLQGWHNFQMTPANKVEMTSHTITIRSASQLHAELIQAMTDKNILYLTVTPRFAEGDILIISDCKSAEIFKVQAILANKSSQMITTVDPLNFHYDAFAEVAKFEVNTFFVADTGRKSARNVPIMALYKSNINHTKTELVEGVKDLMFYSDHAGVGFEFVVSMLDLVKKEFSYVAY